ncbi:LamG-like jellyroll fold domain-containing protein [Psychromicrobium lacuslunae]|uniref:LamG-like jellyroll fold domain-containing protein n=1 Tax=Psychromicrobium lacuslunae TaxID=1618207 RepID=A0A0D4BX51_9MICC|nr:LamG-like jellyroll fold domain-containing protein [Psychromicrobium lacuslunae]AJT40904.1 hypothetical protein UM93_04150 [Psychromicrobium lacuslunae]
MSSLAPVVAGALFLSVLIAPLAAADNPPAAAGPKTESQAVTEAVSQGIDVVAEAETTATELTVAHPDGTVTTTFDNEPVRMQASPGSNWTDISTDLVTKTVGGEQVLVPEAVPAAITLSNGGTAQMSSVSDKEGHVIEQSWPFGTLPVPTVSGNVATYPQVLPDVDLVQVAGKTGVSQVLKIYTPQAANDPRVVDMRVYLDSHNAAVSSDGQGGLKATGTDTGQVELSSSHGLWWDSKDPSASALDAGNNALPRPFSLNLTTQGGQQVQRFDMAAILATPSLSYPLYVDPDWSVARNGYLYVDSGYPSTNYWNGQYPGGSTDGTGHVGYLPVEWAPDGQSHVTRSFYQFNTTPLFGKLILAARVNTVETWSPSCTARPVSAWQVGQVGAGTTWNAQPVKYVKLSTQNVAHGNSASCPQATVGFDLGASKGVVGSNKQFTMGLYADNESDSLGWKKFANAATLIVTYDTRPVTPVTWGITGGAWSGTPGTPPYVTRFRNPIFYVDAYDPDGNNGGTIVVTMAVKNAAGTVVFQGPPGTPIPGEGGRTAQQSPSLADGKYTLLAEARDQQGLASPLMSFAFTVDTTAPNPPIVTPITAAFDANHHDPDGVVGATGYDFKIANPGKYPADGYVYAVTSGPPTSAFPASYSCGTRTREYVVVCPGQAPASIHLAAIDTSTTITAWTFDQAGNVGQIIKGAGSAYTFTVGHLAEIPQTVLPTSTVGNASVVDVELQGGKPVGTSCQGGLPADSPALEKAQALQFSAAGDYASTVGSAVDTAKSFSVSGWFCSVDPTASSAQSLITQQAGAGSPGAALRLSSSGLAELATFTGAAGAGAETVQHANALSSNRWYFVSAVYDQINRQLRITLTTDGKTSTWTVATTADSHRSSAANQPVLLGAAGTSGTGQQFIGQLYQPVLSQGILNPQQLSSTQSAFNGQLGVLK